MGVSGISATGYDSYVSYATGAAEKMTQIVANQIYHSTVSNSSSRVEAYRKLLNVANKADAVRRLSGPIKAIGKWGGVAGAAVGGVTDVYGDINNPNYDSIDKRKAIAVDVSATVASIATGLGMVVLLPASTPILVGIAAGVVSSAIISYGASVAKERWID